MLWVGKEKGTNPGGGGGRGQTQVEEDSEVLKGASSVAGGRRSQSRVEMKGSGERWSDEEVRRAGERKGNTSDLKEERKTGSEKEGKYLRH